MARNVTRETVYTVTRQVVSSPWVADQREGLRLDHRKDEGLAVSTLRRMWEAAGFKDASARYPGAVAEGATVLRGRFTVNGRQDGYETAVFLRPIKVG